MGNKKIGSVKLLCYTESCTSEGNIRLVGGTTIYEGRVEICTSGVWSTVCDDFWGPPDAQVVCRQLGHVTDGMNCKQNCGGIVLGYLLNSE